MLSIIQAAGWPIWPLILCSVVALALVIERLYHLRASLVAPPNLMEEVLGITRKTLWEKMRRMGIQPRED